MYERGASLNMGRASFIWWQRRTWGALGFASRWRDRYIGRIEEEG